MDNKRGFNTLQLVAFIFLGFFLLIMIGVYVYSFGVVDDVLSSINFTVGNYTWNETYTEILQPGIIAQKTTFPSIVGIGILLGMVLVMLLISYSSERKNNLWLILDIFAIIFAEIVAVILKENFLVFINSSPEFLAIFSGSEMSLASKFILNLPTIIPITGVLIIILSYFIYDRKEEITY